MPPARHGFCFPDLVSEKELSNAVGLKFCCSLIVLVVGPAIAVLIALIGTGLGIYDQVCCLFIRYVLLCILFKKAFIYRGAQH